MDTRVLRHDDAAHPKPGTAGGWTMRSMDGRPKRSCGLVFTLLASLFLGSAVASADVVLDWNTIAVNTAVANHQNPFAQARYAAIVQLAVFEAVNPIRGDYQPYLGNIVAPPGASADAAAVQAACRVLITSFKNSGSGR